MLWLKAFHIVFVVTWFAGLFYLPRLFVYHATVNDPESLGRFQTMERRLFVLMSVGAALAALFGAAMLMRAPALLGAGWLQIKLALVCALVAYHIACYRLMQTLRNGTSQRSQQWFRAFNEVPTVFLIAIVLLAVLKPF